MLHAPAAKHRSVGLRLNWHRFITANVIPAPVVPGKRTEALRCASKRGRIVDTSAAGKAGVSYLRQLADSVLRLRKARKWWC